MPNKKIVLAFGFHEEASDVDFLRRLASEQHIDAIGLELSVEDNEKEVYEQSLENGIIRKTNFPKFYMELLAFIKEYEVIPKILGVYSKNELDYLTETMQVQNKLLQDSLYELQHKKNLDKVVKNATVSIKLAALRNNIREDRLVKVVSQTMQELEEHPKLRHQLETVMLASLGEAHYPIYGKIAESSQQIEVKQRFQYGQPFMLYYDLLIIKLEQDNKSKIEPMEAARAIYGVLLYGIAHKLHGYSRIDSINLSNDLVSRLSIRDMGELTRKLVPRNPQDNARIIWDYAHERVQRLSQ